MPVVSVVCTHLTVTWKSVKRVANHPDIALELLTSREIYWHFVCLSVYVESDNVSSSI
jgi:predicted signal transduction protein with EAL and GGDEF domain